MYFGQIKRADTADGIGFRVSLFVSGCRNHCEGCFQPETWDFNYGQKWTPQDEENLLKELSKPFYDGITFLGGEVFEEENQPEILLIIKDIKKLLPQKTIWCYTGYTWDDLQEGGKKNIPSITSEILKNTDVLIDGPFILSKLDVSLNYRGSSNQCIIDVQQTLKQGKIVLSELNN